MNIKESKAIWFQWADRLNWSFGQGLKILAQCTYGYLDSERAWIGQESDHFL